MFPSMTPQSGDSCNASVSSTCAIHKQHFALILENFLRCTIADQVRLFRYVDKFAPANHMIYFLMKESMTTMNRTKTSNRDGEEREKEARRNKAIHVYDGLERRLANTANPPNSNNRCLVVQSVRDYTLVLHNLMPGMVPRNAAERAPRGVHISIPPVEEEEESTSEEENEQPGCKRKHPDVDTEVRSRTRNNYKLFSKSPRSMWVLYEQAFRKYSQFYHSCSSEWRLDKHNERLSLRHTAQQVIANNLGALLSTNVVLVEPTSNANIAHNILVGAESSANSARIVRINKLITASPENAILNPDCSWNVNSVFTVEMPSGDQYTQQSDDLNADTQELIKRLVELRQRVKDLVSDSESNTDSYDGAADDEHSVQRLHRLAHQERKPTEFRLAHEQEYSLVHLRNMTEHCVHLAHANATHILDFVFFSEFDAWDFINLVLDYGIRSYRENGVYPIKHALWDIVLFARKPHRTATRITDTLSLSNYRAVWLYSNTTVVGGLTQFAQSFRHILRTTLCTSCSYFLNRKVMNTRKNGQRHDCLLPKTSQGTYYAMFLRLQAGHELVCCDHIENDTDAVKWFRKYESINNHLWRKRRISRCLALSDHLTEAAEETGGGSDGLRMTKIMPPPTYDYTGLVDRHDRKTKEKETENDCPVQEGTSDDEDDDMSLLDYTFEDE